MLFQFYIYLRALKSAKVEANPCLELVG